MKRLMPKAEWIFGDCLIKLSSGRASPLTHQRFVAAEGAQPIAGRSFGGRNPQVRQQVADSAASNERQPCRYRRSFHEMLVTINEPGRKHLSTQPDHASAWTDVQLNFVVAAMHKNSAVTYSDGIAAGMTPDNSMMQDQISLFGTHPPIPFSGC
jgi:hypothetical protein